MFIHWYTTSAITAPDFSIEPPIACDGTGSASLFGTTHERVGVNLATGTLSLYTTDLLFLPRDCPIL